eukprot:NODE_3917_length_893_cov_39.274882_g3465_i1.p1 GENE.NODE_3917_length_893_cov_39.274882_g3465_i1~~NODE_3917_length_893_cov_39.274882_g3465_i1.p1  ORF type:complete len:236 (+),score=52.01 NODE_3917_length_893_cov_39.274882_g3465_i1:72-779(+)
MNVPMQDPFEAVKNEVNFSFRKLHESFDRWRLQRDQPSKSQVQVAIKTIERDLEDVKEAIGIVRGNRRRFQNVSDKELADRDNFVANMQLELQTMKSEIDLQPAGFRQELLTKPAKNNCYSPLEEDLARDNQDFIDQQLLQQQEQEKEQGLYLTDIQNGVKVIKKNAVDIGAELKEHDRIIGDLETEMDTLQGKLKFASRRVEQLIASTEDKGKMCCIGVLIVILVVLIVLFFLF